MAGARATSRTPRRRRRRARAVTFLARTCRRLLRFLATHRRRRRGLGLTTTSTGDSSPSGGQAPLRWVSFTTPQEGQAPEAAAAQPGLEEQHGDGDDAAASEAEAAAVAGKYWAQRYSLFSLYDRGVRMDAEGWYSATPEAIAAAQAARAPPGSLVLDAFAGVGGNSIQFAARGCYVVAVEIDPRKAELAAHNARIYGVEDRIEFVVGDFFNLAPSLKADLVFLSPPWGGPSYSQAPVYSLDMLKPKDGCAIFQAAQEISPNIIMFLPRNVDINQVEQLSWLSSPPLDFVSEENYIEHRFKGITAYFGVLHWYLIPPTPNRADIFCRHPQPAYYFLEHIISHSQKDEVCQNPCLFSKKQSIK